MSTSKDSKKYVSRTKYEKIKKAGMVWSEKCNILREQLQEQVNIVNQLRKEYEKISNEAKRWKNLSEQLPDTETLSELEEENSKLQDKLLKKERELDSIHYDYKEKIVKLEREKILSEGKIERLEDTCTDLRSRYAELKEDYREQRRWGTRNKNISN